MGRKFDTLDDVDVAGASDIADVYHLVLGQAMAADDLCGIVTTGPLNQSHSPSGHWGFKPLSFHGHPEVWFVRSAPAGRTGLPLEQDEMRQVSVLVQHSAGSKDSTVTNIKLWRRPDNERLLGSHAEMDIRQNSRGYATLGPSGVATHSIRLFEKRVAPGAAFYALDNFRCAVPSIATVLQAQEGGILRRIESLPMTHYAMMASMVGMPFVDSPRPRSCEIRFQDDEWETYCVQNMRAFKNMYKKYFGVQDENKYVKLVMSAEEVCEQASFVGYLDQRADPFYLGAMQDDLHKPSGMPLIVAIAVCIACNPATWGLPPTRGDDAFSTREAQEFIETLLPATLTQDSGDKGVQWTHSVDTVINFGLTRIQALVRKLESGKFDGAPEGVDHRRISSSMHATLHYLMYTGTAVCTDLFGLPPQGVAQCNAHAHGTGTGTGSHHLRDPVLESRRQSAYAKKLGNVVARWPCHRTSTRGKRQLALASVFVDVDDWLRTGKYRGVVLHPTSQASFSVWPEQLDPTATPARPQTSTTRGSKKKKRPEALLAERGKQREARQQCAASLAVRCMFRSSSVTDCDVLAASKKLCGEAVNAASAIFVDILQQGACVGMDDLFKFKTHLVAPTSKIQCAHCENTVDVVESVAFSGTLGTCALCKHPRCLECVSADIAVHGAGGLAEPTDCKYCHNGERSDARARGRPGD